MLRETLIEAELEDLIQSGRRATRVHRPRGDLDGEMFAPQLGGPRVLSYPDVRHKRIDVYAQKALLRMSRDPAQQADAGLFEPQKDTAHGLFWAAKPSPTEPPAEFRFLVFVGGTYQVSLWWPNSPGANPAVPVDIAVLCPNPPCPSAGMQSVLVDQTRGGGGWVSIGAPLLLTTVVEVVVRIKRSSTRPGLILADAVRLLRP